MHYHTELPLVDEWVSFLHYLKNGWQNAVLLWCMLQAGPPSLHHYYAVVLHTCIVLPPVGHSSNRIIVVNLQDNRAVFRIFIALLRFYFDSPSHLPRHHIHLTTTSICPPFNITNTITCITNTRIIH